MGLESGEPTALRYIYCPKSARRLNSIRMVIFVSRPDFLPFALVGELTLAGLLGPTLT